MRRTSLAVSLSLPLLVLALLQACSSSDPSTPNGGNDSTKDAAPRGDDDDVGDDDDDDDVDPEDAGGGEDTGTADTGACTTPVAANLDGTESCKTLPFGTAAVNFVAVDPQGPDTMGGTLPAGIYDVTSAERTTPKGSWRETLVVDGAGKFTRIRQLDTGTGNGLGPITYVSGSYTTSGSDITFVTECVMGGTGKVGDKTTLPFGVAMDGCQHARFFFSFTGFRVTLTQR